MGIILVQLSEHDWTLQAVHFACAMARSQRADVILLRLDYVRHPMHLGTEYGRTPPSEEEIEVYWACASIAEQYDVTLQFKSIQCATKVGALLTAGDEHAAAAIFVHFPVHHIAYWRRFQIWKLNKSLAAMNCQLFTLDVPTKTLDSAPAITVSTAHGPLHR